MTEDDTFRMLRRPDISEMKELYLEFTRDGRSLAMDHTDFLYDYGWTLWDFLEASGRFYPNTWNVNT